MKSIKQEIKKALTASPALFSCFLVFLMSHASAAVAQNSMADFDIRKYSADITVKSDGVIHVNEIINVRFFADRHGIVRNIPIIYPNSSGDKVSIKVRLTGVLVNDESSAYITDMSGNDLVIKIGDPDKLVTGNQEYKISYDVERALLFTDKTDEIYWNVTGSAWPVVPRVVHTTVQLPKGVLESKIETSCYTGSVGSTLSQCEISKQTQDGITTISYSANDFLTVAARFERGLIARPSLWQKILWFASDNKIVGLPLAVFLILFFYWWRNGRDPKPLAIVTEFDAPEKLSPAEIGVMVDGKVDDREFSSTIVDLAVRGYLKIIEEEEGGLLGKSRSFAIERTEKPLHGLKDHELLLLEAVMGTAKRRELADMPSRASEVKAKRDEATRLLYSQMALRKWFVANPESVRNGFLTVGVMIIIASVWFVSGVSVAWMFSLIASGLLIIIFGTIMPKRTEAGTRLFEKALGFKQYLSKAETYRLQWQEKEGIFEKFLPYAMVFMVVDKWTDALASAIRQPDWYQGSRPGVWDVYLFNSAMRDLNSSLNNAVMVAPKSASSGGSGIGGGFSGGGFGGGGGGSW